MPRFRFPEKVNFEAGTSLVHLERYIRLGVAQVDQGNPEFIPARPIANIYVGGKRFGSDRQELRSAWALVRNANLQIARTTVINLQHQTARFFLRAKK